MKNIPKIINWLGYKIEKHNDDNIWNLDDEKNGIKINIRRLNKRIIVKERWHIDFNTPSFSVHSYCMIDLKSAKKTIENQIINKRKELNKLYRLIKK